MSAPRPVIEAHHLTRTLSGEIPVTLVQDVEFTAYSGELLAITGPSGSGKSSLLYLLGLLDKPTSGEVLIEGKPTASLDSDQLAALRLANVGFVFQFHFLLPEFTVLENVTIPMQKAAILDADAIAARGAKLLNDLGLDSGHDKRPDQLSGGQRQRVAIARALANNPQIILADEPTGNLDQKNAAIVFDIFTRLAREQGKTIITVTHDAELAARCFRRVHIVDGRIRE